MASKRIKILGICGSPRRMTTDRAMEEVFRAIQEFDWAETEYLHLADYTLRPCTGCMACFGFNAPAEEPWHCYRFPEDQKWEIIPKMMACDGIVLGTPVYGCGATALLRMLIEMTPFGYYTFTKHAGAMRHKTLGVVTVGGADIEGQETVGMDLWRWGLRLGMLPVSCPPTREDTLPVASVSGAFLSTVDSKVQYSREGVTKEGTRTIPPNQGSRNMRSCRNLGREMVVVTTAVKLGLQAMREKDMEIPQTRPYKFYSLTPKSGSYVDKLVREKKIEVKKFK
jgi:multimeric flavodoxin WrbA